MLLQREFPYSERRRVASKRRLRKVKEPLLVSSTTSGELYVQVEREGRAGGEGRVVIVDPDFNCSGKNT